jgi:hypothetical protein
MSEFMFWVTGFVVGWSAASLLCNCANIKRLRKEREQ